MQKKLIMQKNTYIQDKLLEKHICRFNDGECNCDCYIAGMQDYHNHIVEKIDDAIKNHQIANSYAEGILEGMMHCKHLILQDTNPKE